MASPTQAPDLAAVKQRQQQMWSSGDYGMIGTMLLLLGEMLCEAADVRPGQKVLDVATGHGNTALAAARRFCETTGIDYVPELLERGRERAAAERLQVSFVEGDAEDIPFPDEAFDVVLSTIGAMFAPNQEKAASELLRVCRSGGKIAMSNWTPTGYTGEFFRTMGKYVPPPPGLKSPMLWGTEERLRELFGDGVSSLQVENRTFVLRYPSPEYFVNYHRTYFGPTVRAFATLDEAGQENLASDLLGVLNKFNSSGDETLMLQCDYLEVVATKR